MATLYPQKYPEVYKLLLTIRGFDTVDDESEYEATTINDLLKDPNEWTSDENPPYAYYLYYLYANI